MLEELLEEHENRLEAKMHDLNDALKEMFNSTPNHTFNNRTLCHSENIENSVAYAFARDGKFWDAPK